MSRLAESPDAVPPPRKPRPIRSVSVIGAGMMGRGIAVANVEHDVPVTITDTSAETLSAGIAAILDETILDETSNRSNPRVCGSTSAAELARADLVIEAVADNLRLKRKVFAELEPHLRGETILASNTSSIPIARIAAGLENPERVCGLHFCHPVRNRPLVEVIPGRQTSDDTLATAIGYVKAIGKLPIVVQDRPGFLINRLLLPYMNEAAELLLEGADVESVEATARAFGMPLGPLSQFDAFGIDVAVRTGARLHLAFPDRVVASDLLIALYKTGRLGRKSGAGFFRYRNSTDQGTPNREVERMIRDHLRSRNVFTREQITARLFLPMLLEATRVLEERVVRSAGEVDSGLKNGIGFPSSAGGLLLRADSLGAARIIESLKPFEHLGKRYEPTQWLLDMAQRGRGFYDSAAPIAEHKPAA